MEDNDLKLGIYPKVNYLSEALDFKFKSKDILTKLYLDANEIEPKNINYLIINFIDFDISKNKSEIDKIVSLIKQSTCKIVILYPQYVKSDLCAQSQKFVDELVVLNSNLSLILIPILLGKSVKYKSDDYIYDVIFQSTISDRIKIKNDGRLINFASLGKFCDKVVKETLSFGSLGKKLGVVGERRLVKTVATKYLKISDQNLIFLSGQYNIEEIKSDESVKVDFSLRSAVNNTVYEFKKNTKEQIQNPEVIKTAPVESKKVYKKTNKFRFFFKLALIFIFLISIPLILLLISTLLIFIAFKTYNPINNSSQNLIYAASQISQTVSSISFGNQFYFNSASIIQKTTDLASEGISLVKLGTEFQNKIMGRDNYDLSYYSDNVSASLDKIHTNLSFLQTEIPDFNFYINQKTNIFNLKKKVYEFRVLASRLSVLLGVEKPAKYLVLFQNNMELRPTGGFIGSYAIITFDKGKLTEINVSDVYSADGQLKGHVDPPEPIRKHLGEGGWYMRDANWDPDFKKSADKIEWFLDKEINEQVNGVIAIDLSFIKDILEVIGPVDLVDFNKQITHLNLYSETQSEVEESFFPGSIKKASFLTSLSKNLIIAVENLPGEKRMSLFSTIYKNLVEKHIQLYLHDKNSQKALSNLGFAGEINMDTKCNIRCISDKYLLVDANLGVNKSNLFIERSQVLNTLISKTEINHELTVKYTNNAGVAVGKSGIYKTYTRIYLPKDASILGVRVYDVNGKYENINFDQTSDEEKKEIGFLIEVVPSSQKLVQIVWNLNTDQLLNGGEYNLTILKQAGTDNDSLKVVARVKDLTLTGKPVTVYNTNLIRDFNLKLFVK